MKHFKRILCLLLTLCLCVGLFGCSKGSGGKNTTSTADLHVYKSTEVDTKLDSYADSFDNNTVILNDRIYLVGYTYDDSDAGVQYKLLSVGLDGSDPQAIPLDTLNVDDPTTQSASFNGLMSDDSGNLYLLEQVYTSGTEEAGWTDASQTYYVNQIDTSGNILNSFAFSAPENSWLNVASSVCMNGNFYFFTYDSIFVVPTDGSATKTFPVLSDGNGYLNALYRQGDSLLCSYYGGENWEYHLCTVDLQTGKLGPDLNVPDSMRNATALVDPNGKLYFTDENGIYSVDTNAGTATLLCSWLDSDIDSSGSIQTLRAMADGTFLATGNGENWDKFLLTTLTYVDPATLPEKTILRLGCAYSWSLQRAVLKFNRASDTVRITLVDYSQYDSEENNWNGSTTQLNTDIISGNVPDILLVDNSLPFQSYVNKGLFTDLYPLLDADESLSREDFVSNVLEACENDGKLTSIVPYYDIVTAVAPAGMVDSAAGWTWDQFFSVLQQYPDIKNALPSITRDSVLNIALMLSGDQYIDYSTGTCHFDSPAFQQLLEYAATYPAEISDNDYKETKDWFAEGQALMNITYLYDFTCMREQTYTLNGPVVFKGFPTADGTGGSAIMPYMQLAISQGCADKTAAWEFISSFLTQEYQDDITGDLPLRVDSLQKMADRAMNPDDSSSYIGGITSYASNTAEINAVMSTDDTAAEDSGETTEETADTAAEDTAEAGDIADDDIAGGDLNSEDYWNRAVTQAEIDQMMDVIHSTKTLYQWDQSLTNIITEEVAAFFNGSKTAADTAAIIQNRASTYLSESR